MRHILSCNDRTKQSAVVLCLEGTLVSWLLVSDGHGEHNGLRGSVRRSVTPYVYGRRELYCSSLALFK
jgi:hypothetical protein